METGPFWGGLFNDRMDRVDFYLILFTIVFSYLWPVYHGSVYFSRIGCCCQVGGQVGLPRWVFLCLHFQNMTNV